MSAKERLLNHLRTKHTQLEILQGQQTGLLHRAATADVCPIPPLEDCFSWDQPRRSKAQIQNSIETEMHSVCSRWTDRSPYDLKYMPHLVHRCKHLSLPRSCSTLFCPFFTAAFCRVGCQRQGVDGVCLTRTRQKRRDPHLDQGRHSHTGRCEL